MQSRPVRPRPAWLRALGHDDPPFEIVIAGRSYRRVDIFKHDSWAATARYRGAKDEVVCKFNRVQPILGLPMAWLGRRLAWREGWALRQLAGVRGIPKGCGPVFVEGRCWRNAVAHRYVHGHPLGRHERVSRKFFPALRTLIATVHYHGLAYVDLHKRENILVGECGLPYLIDFQVYFSGRSWNPILRATQRADWYHLAKHLRCHRPDQLELVRSRGGGQRPGWIRIHRLVAAPLRQLRRGLLTTLGVRAAGGQAITEHFPEDAVRREYQQAA